MSGSEPLENVLDFYGGNYESMREEYDDFADGFDFMDEAHFLEFEKKLLFEDADDCHDFQDEIAGIGYSFDMKVLNKNTRGNLVVAPSSRNFDETD